MKHKYQPDKGILFIPAPFAELIIILIIFLAILFILLEIEKQYPQTWDIICSETRFI